MTLRSVNKPIANICHNFTLFGDGKRLVRGGGREIERRQRLVLHGNREQFVSPFSQDFPDPRPILEQVNTSHENQIYSRHNQQIVAVVALH